MTAQPEALRLADVFDCVTDDGCGECIPCRTAVELRRLHADVKALREENAELRVWFGSEAQRSGLLQRKLNAAEAENDALQKANRLLQQHHATAWNRGHTMGMHANEAIAKQALDAVKKDAWGNTQLTEALMAAEAENEALRAALHSISLAGSDSGSTREGMALYARAALAAKEKT